LLTWVSRRTPITDTKQALLICLHIFADKGQLLQYINTRTHIMAHRMPPYIRLPCGRLEESIRILWLNGLREGDNTIKGEEKEEGAKFRILERSSIRSMRTCLRVRSQLVAAQFIGSCSACVCRSSGHLIRPNFRAGFPFSSASCRRRLIVYASANLLSRVLVDAEGSGLLRRWRIVPLTPSLYPRILHSLVVLPFPHIYMTTLCKTIVMWLLITSILWI